MFNNNESENMKKQQFDNGTYFKVRWFADIYQETITRNAKWDDQCKTWISKKGDQCMTFNNYDARTENKYRTAKNYEVLNV